MSKAGKPGAEEVEAEAVEGVEVAKGELERCRPSMYPEMKENTTVKHHIHRGRPTLPKEGFVMVPRPPLPFSRPTVRPLISVF